MPKIIKPLRIAVDLQALFARELPADASSLLHRGAARGALGGITLFSEVFDLYLLSQYTDLNIEEILRWLKSGQVDICFRRIILVDENLRNLYLQNNIGITIASDRKLAEFAKDISITYWLQEAHTLDIQDGIQKVNLWKDLVRDITKYSTMDDYDFRYAKN